MAKTWIVTPNDGVTAVTNGVYLFPANDSYDDKVYTVTLKDTDCNCVAHKTVTVKGKTRPGCSCSITSKYGTTSSKISGKQHTNVKVGTFASYFCTGTTSFSYASGDADFLSNFTYVGDDIYANVSSNVSYTNSRMAIYNASCGGSLTIYQDKGEESCPTSPTGIIQVGSYIGAAGGNNIPISVWVKENEVYTSHTVTSTDESIISNITDGQLYPGGDREIKANVASNESSDFRRYPVITVTVFGPTLPSTGCQFTITLTQEGSCATINNTRYVGPMHNYELDGTAQTGAAIMYVPYITPYSTTAWTTSYFYGTYSFVRNLTVIEGGGGPGGTRSMTVDIDENNTGADRTFKVRLVGNKTDGGQCARTVEITQKKKDTPPVCGCNAITYNGTYEADPTVPTQTIQFTLKINNTTNNIVYFDEGVINFNNGVSKTINPGCEGVNGNETKTIGTFTLYNAPDPATIASATIEASHQSNCSGYAVTSVTPDITTLTNGCTLTLTYNG